MYCEGQNCDFVVILYVVINYLRLCKLFSKVLLVHRLLGLGLFGFILSLLLKVELRIGVVRCKTRQQVQLSRVFYVEFVCC